MRCLIYVVNSYCWKPNQLNLVFFAWFCRTHKQVTKHCHRHRRSIQEIIIIIISMNCIVRNLCAVYTATIPFSRARDHTHSTVDASDGWCTSSVSIGVLVFHMCCAFVSALSVCPKGCKPYVLGSLYYC